MYQLLVQYHGCKKIAQLVLDLQKSFPDRPASTLHDIHLHALPPCISQLFQIMCCFESKADIDGILLWCSKLNAWPILALSMYRRPMEATRLRNMIRVSLMTSKFRYFIVSDGQIDESDDESDDESEDEVCMMCYIVWQSCKDEFAE